MFVMSRYVQVLSLSWWVLLDINGKVLSPAESPHVVYLEAFGRPCTGSKGYFTGGAGVGQSVTDPLVTPSLQSDLLRKDPINIPAQSRK